MTEKIFIQNAVRYGRIEIMNPIEVLKVLEVTQNVQHD